MGGAWSMMVGVESKKNPIWSLHTYILGIHSKEMAVHVYQKAFPRIFIVTLLITHWNPPKCQSITK